MKILAIIFILAVCLGLPCRSQVPANADSCLSYPGIDTFIAGYVDTAQQDGVKVRAIRASLLTRGFELLTRDSSFHIERFVLTFDARNGNLYAIVSKGSKIDPRTDMELAALQKIAEATLITIDNVIVRQKKVCFRGISQVYFNR